MVNRTVRTFSALRRRGGRALALASVLAALFAWTAPLSARAERARRDEPLLGVYLQPSLSLLLPSSSTPALDETYGVAHPTGSVGVSLQLTERFALLLELEAQGWSGELPAVDQAGIGTTVAPFHIRFLNYWLHLRARVMLLRAGRFQLHLDAIVGMVFGREDGDRFRAEGQGVALGLGPVAWLTLGRYAALSLGAVIESGWVWYDVVSAHSREANSQYTLLWPRALITLGFHGILVHRSPRRRVPVPTTTPSQTTPAEGDSREAMEELEELEESGLEPPW